MVTNRISVLGNRMASLSSFVIFTRLDLLTHLLLGKSSFFKLQRRFVSPFKKKGSDALTGRKKKKRKKRKKKWPGPVNSRHSGESSLM